MKKFYKQVSVQKAEGGFAVTLDGRTIKSPDKNELSVPRQAVAEAIAAEWQAQEDEIDPGTMPLTRLVNTALDRVATRRGDVIRELVGYGNTDLVCYRADEPAALKAEQAANWDPYLAWLKENHKVSLETTIGIMPIKQSDDALQGLTALVDALDDLQLTAFHAFVAGFGSIVLALALTGGFRPFEDCWQASQLDEAHQEREWGTDYEVEDKRARLKAEMQASLDLWQLLAA